MRCSSLLLRAALPTAVAAFPAASQTVRGTVTLPDSLTPAAGVIVTANGDSGRVARALTTERGAFIMTLPAPGRYAVRALRIGYRPTQGPAVAVATRDTVIVNVVLSGAAVSLAAVEVKGENACRVKPDSGALVARAWEEARKALASAQLVSGDKPLIAEWIEYERTLDPSGRIVRRLDVRSTTGPTSHAFRSVPAESLAAYGYVVPEKGETVYHAPDGDALLSDSFAANHCFQVVWPRTEADSLLGVAFRPAKDRRDFRDIEGTFWLDRHTAELRWMDFRYTSMPDAVAKADAGGRIEYARLGTGGWFIAKWSIRMPVARRAGAVADAGTRRVMRQPNALELAELNVTGGEVVSVRQADSTLYRASGASLDVVAIAHDPKVTLRGAGTRLDGTDYRATLDSTGRARIAPVLEGRYDLRVSTPLMDSLGVEAVRHEVEVSARAHPDTVRIPTREQLLKAACGDSAGAGESLLRGVVRDTSGRTVRDAVVTATWQGSFRMVGASTDRDRNLGWAGKSVGTFTGADGTWRLCGVPRDVPLVIRASADLLGDVRTVRLDPDDAFLSADLALHRTAPWTGAALPDSLVAVVEVMATSAGSVPLPDVRLDLELPGGGSRTLITAEDGRVLVPDARAGRLVVVARKIGFLPGKVSAAIAPGRNTVPIILDAARLPSLDTVRIVGDRRVAGLDRLDEFEDRRLNKLATRTISRAEIEKRNPSATWQLLTNVPALKVADRGDGTVVATMPRVMIQNFSNQPCYPKVMVDGIPVAEDVASSAGFGRLGSAPQAVNLAMLPPPDAIHGIEVFAGPATVPVKFGGAGNGKWCGLIAIWTR
ncbi:MAG: carboxypeptidase regulatory-like domain-containing protein [Gemmatimonadaceae bacterium]|nr:carboxypeptidase regulatory-like domain-containing protein [Gemmatimonadaceae bacterium]